MKYSKFLILVIPIVLDACLPSIMAQGFFNAFFYGERTRLETRDGPLAHERILGQILAGPAPDQLTPLLAPAPHTFGIIFFGGQTTVPGMPQGSTMFFRIAAWDRNLFGENYDNVPRDQVYYSGLGQLILAGGLQPGETLKVSEPAIVSFPQPLRPPEKARAPTQPVYSTTYGLTEPIAQTFRSSFSGKLHSVEMFTGDYPLPVNSLLPQLALAVHEVIDGEVQPNPILTPWIVVNRESNRPRFVFQLDAPPLIRGGVYAMVIEGSTGIQCSIDDVYPDGECFRLENNGPIFVDQKPIQDLRFNYFPQETEERLELWISRTDAHFTEGENIELGAILRSDLRGQVRRVFYFDGFERIGEAPDPDQRIQIDALSLGYHTLVIAAEMADGTRIYSNVKTISVAQPNDSIENARPLEGLNVEASGSLLGTTHQPSETIPNRESELSGVWFQWTAPTAGFLEYGRGDDSIFFESYLFDASNSDGLSLIQGNPIYCEEGKRLNILAANEPFREGNFILSLNLDPLGDDYRNRIPLTGIKNVIQASTENASRELQESNHAGHSGAGSLWWTWQPDASGLARIRFLESAVPLAVAVYQQGFLTPTPRGLIEVASKTFIDDEHNDLIFQARAGEHYDLVVQGIGDARGRFSLELAMPVARLMNPVESIRVQPRARPRHGLSGIETGLIDRVEFKLAGADLSKTQTRTIDNPPFQWDVTLPLEKSMQWRVSAFDQDNRLLLDRSVDFIADQERFPTPPKAASSPVSDNLYFMDHLGRLLGRTEARNPWLNPRVQPAGFPVDSTRWMDVYFFDGTHYLTDFAGRNYIAPTLESIAPLPPQFGSQTRWIKLSADGEHILSLSSEGEIHVDFEWRLPKPAEVESWILLSYENGAAFSLSASNRLFLWQPSRVKGLNAADALVRITEESLPPEAGAVRDLRGNLLLTEDQQIYFRGVSGQWRRLPLPNQIAGWVAVSERGAISNDGRLFLLSPQREEPDQVLDRELTLSRTSSENQDEARPAWLSLSSGQTVMTGVSEKGEAFAWGAGESGRIDFRSNLSFPFPYPLRAFGNLYGENPPRLRTPRNGTSILAGRSAHISLDASSLPTNTTRVEYFTGTNLVGIAGQSPFKFEWEDPKAGTHQITAMVYDENGFIRQSTTAWLSVFDRFFNEHESPMIKDPATVVLPVRIYNPTAVAWHSFQVEVLNGPSTPTIPIERTIAPYSEVVVEVEIETPDPEAWLEAGEELQTIASNIATTPRPPRIIGAAINVRGEFELRLAAPEGRAFRVQASEDLRQWNGASETLFGSGETQIWTDDNPMEQRRYYRLIGKDGVISTLRKTLQLKNTKKKRR